MLFIGCCFEVVATSRRRSLATSSRLLSFWKHHRERRCLLSRVRRSALEGSSCLSYRSTKADERELRNIHLGGHFDSEEIQPPCCQDLRGRRTHSLSLLLFITSAVTEQETQNANHSKKKKQNQTKKKLQSEKSVKRANHLPGEAQRLLSYAQNFRH